MLNNLKEQFFKSFFGTILWISTLFTMFNHMHQKGFMILWSAISISFISSLVFGVFYQWIWNYSIAKSFIKILVSSLVNLATGYICVFLFSVPMFELILPWAFIFLLIEIVMHTITFYFYANYLNKKEVNNIKNLIN